MKAARVIAVLGAALAAIWFFASQRQDARHLLISDAVIRPLEGGDAAAFLSIENSGPPDRLIGVSSPRASATLYSPVAGTGAPIPAGTSALAADGAHIRLDGRFEDGAILPMTLTFAKAGEVSVTARLSDPQAEGAAAEVGLFGLGDICRVEEGEPAPDLSLQVTPDGAGWRVRVAARDFTFSEEMAGLYHVPGMGHGHIYVGGMKLGRLYQPEARIGALPPGRHEVRVTLNTNDHRAYLVGDDPVTATAVIVVD